MQWTFLLLIILLPLIIGMIVSREFRAAILSRRLSVSTSGIEMEPTATTAARQPKDWFSRRPNGGSFSHAQEGASPRH